MGIKLTMPWGSSVTRVTGEGLGKQQKLDRAGIAAYRDFGYTRFMLTVKPSVFGKVWGWTLAYMVFAIATVFFDKYVFALTLPNGEVLKMFTIPTGFLLLFRCNMGYARFWEGRGHYGVFNFALREVTRRCYTFIRGSGVHDPEATAIRHNVLRLLMVMAISVKQNLRERSIGPEARFKGLEKIRQYLTVKEFAMFESVAENRPLLVMSWIGKGVHQAYLGTAPG